MKVPIQPKLPQILAATFAILYLLRAGLPVLFDEGHPFFKFRKLVDLPVYWFFQLAETLGLCRLVSCYHYNHGPSVLGPFVFVSLAAPLYAVMGYILGAVITVLLSEKKAFHA